MNIQAVLTSLNKLMSDTKIGDEIGASQATVTRLRNGKHKTTCYERAEKIRKLALREGVLNEDAST
jgi:DNA-binding Xre family transcriptional regulator